MELERTFHHLRETSIEGARLARGPFFRRGRLARTNFFEGAGFERAKRSFGRGPAQKAQSFFGMGRVRWFALKGGVRRGNLFGGVIVA